MLIVLSTDGTHLIHSISNRPIPAKKKLVNQMSKKSYQLLDPVTNGKWQVWF